MTSEPALQDISTSVLQVAASVFEVDVDDLGLDTSPETLDSWDSLNHLRLITAIETSFGVHLSMQAVMGIDTIKALIETVEKLKNP